MFFSIRKNKSITIFSLIILIINALMFSAFAAVPPNFDNAAIETNVIKGNGEPNGLNYNTLVSGDGRYIVFISDSTNFTDDTNDAICGLFLYDSQTETIELISKVENGVAIDEKWDKINYYNGKPDGVAIWYVGTAEITPDGKYICFSSKEYIYIRNMIDGRTESISVSLLANTNLQELSISNDGRYISYIDFRSIYVYDREAGARIVIYDDNEIDGYELVSTTISGNGKYIVYEIFNKTTWYNEVWVCEIDTGRKVRIDKHDDGTFFNKGGLSPKISDDGRFIAFSSFNDFVTDAGLGESTSVYVHDRDMDKDGIFDEPGNFNTFLVSKSSSGEPANDASGGILDTFALSGSGRYITYISAGNNLVVGDNNNRYDVFIHDIEEGKTIRASILSNGKEIVGWDDFVDHLSISWDGGTVVYTCDYLNLGNGDTNEHEYVFISKIIEKSNSQTSTTQEQALNKPSIWANEYISTSISHDLVPANLQNLYQISISRSEFCALAVQAYEIIKGFEIGERKSFGDTTDINVQKMGGLGVVSGVGDNKFAPNVTITREEAATLLSNLMKALGKPLAEEASTFSDNSRISSWAIGSVGKIQAAGIMSGVGDNRFSPSTSYTREQSIVTILKIFNMVN